MIYVCTCLKCGIVVRTEREQGEVACNCQVSYTIEPEVVDVVPELPPVT